VYCARQRGRGNRRRAGHRRICRAQPRYAGLDQVNVYVPRSLAGAGEVPVVLTADGVTANVVTVNIK